jgi:hypothetical protein
MGKVSMAIASQTNDLQTVLDVLRANLPQLTSTYKVKSLGVFGSQVRGEARSGSDLDILVEFDEAPTLFEFVRLQRRLSQLAATDVDLVMKSGLKPNIGERILREVVPV